jgi:hypothetical protein
MPDNDMGDPKNITNKTFNEASKAAGQSAEEPKQTPWTFCKKRLAKDKQPKRKRSDPRTEVQRGPRIAKIEDQNLRVDTPISARL